MAETLVSGLADRAREILSRSRIYVIRTLEVTQQDDCVVLRGNVDSFYHKQLAQELLRGDLPSVEIINHISVVYRHRDWWDEIDPQHRPAQATTEAPAHRIDVPATLPPTPPARDRRKVK